MIVYEAETFMNEDGLEVIRKTKFEIVDDELTSPHTEEVYEYAGTLVVNTPVGQAQITFDFPEDLTMRECFEQYSTIAEEKVEALKKEMMEREAASKLITPSNNLIIP